MSSEYEIVARNADLEDLGFKPHEYGINWTFNFDNRKDKWAKERETYGFDSRETWNFDILLIEYIYTHLKMFLREADTIVDLSYPVFVINNEEFTFEEMIKMICEDCATALKNYNDEGTITDMSNTFSMLAKILPHLWW